MEHCPHCQHRILTLHDTYNKDREEIEKNAGFAINCPNCGTSLEVVVDVSIRFHLYPTD